MRKYYPLLGLLVIFVLLSTGVELKAEQGISIQDVSIESNGRMLSGIYAQPEGTHDESALPGVAVFHGFTASKEMMRPFIEGMARIGIAVLAVDQQGHGLSTGRLGEDGNNSLRNDGVAVIEYLRQIREIDRDRIGILGHSMGAGTAIATSTYVGDLRSTVLLGNSLSDIDQYNVTPTFPQNVLMGIGKYDELFTVDISRESFQSMVAVPAEINTRYGDFSEGTARELKVTGTDHIFEVLNPGLVERSIEWIYKSLIDETVSLEDKQLQSVNGWSYILDQFLTLLAGLALIGLIPLILQIEPQDNHYVDKKTNWISHGVLAFTSFMLAIPIILISSRSFSLLFVSWFFLGTIFYALKRAKQTDESLLKSIKVAVDFHDDCFYTTGILIGLLASVQVMLTFVHWDFRYVLPLLSALTIRRFGLFMILWVAGSFYFALEITALQGEEKLGINQYLRDSLARTWAFALLLLLNYVPIIVFKTPILPTFIGFLAFFIVGLLPAILVLSVFSTVGRAKGWSPLSIAILSAGIIAWMLASTLSFNA